MSYQHRIIDCDLDELLPALTAIALEGPRGVGKTATALQRAVTVRALDDSDARGLVSADPANALLGPVPVLIDEWQLVPEVWDAVRRAVDNGAKPGSFLLTGSASSDTTAHSGAGRIVSLRMRPMSLAERALVTPTVSLRGLLSGQRVALTGTCDLGLNDYAHEVVASGFPGIRSLPRRARELQLEGYVQRIVDRDFKELGHAIRDAGSLRRWMSAYAAATSTTASFETIRAAATAGQNDKPAKTTTMPYRAVLERLWLLEAIPAWAPTRNRISRLAMPPKHQLADPALAATLLGVDADALLTGTSGGPRIPRDGPLLGALFESLVALSVRTYAQARDATVRHLRTAGGGHEVDLIVERRDGRILALEVKLGSGVTDQDVRHLAWLGREIGNDLLDAIVVTTGAEAYRRADGIGVVPAALLGP